MKAFIILLVLFGAFLPHAFGALDHPGLQKDWAITTDNYTFHVVTVSNFDITNMTFDKDKKEITLDITSPNAGNLAEVQIPHNLIGGNLTAFIHGTKFIPKIQQDNRISFMTLSFDNKGNNTINIIGTTYLPEFSIVPLVLIIAFFIIVFSTRIMKF